MRFAIRGGIDTRIAIPADVSERKSLKSCPHVVVDRNGRIRTAIQFRPTGCGRCCCLLNEMWEKPWTYPQRAAEALYLGI